MSDERQRRLGYVVVKDTYVSALEHLEEVVEGYLRNVAQPEMSTVAADRLLMDALYRVKAQRHQHTVKLD